MPPFNKGRQSLARGLDREVHQVVDRLIEREPRAETIRQLTTTSVYIEIQSSSSSLSRKPKKLLQDSIERVLATYQQELEVTNPETTAPKSVETPAEMPSNGLNRSIVGAWSANRDEDTTSPVRIMNRNGEFLSNSINSSTKDHTEPRQRRQLNGESLPKKRKTPISSTTIDRSPPTNISLRDLGGIDDVVKQLKEILVVPLKKPQLLVGRRRKTPRGVLIHGPPGCGKTMIAKAFAAELNINFISIAAPSIVSGMSGESEKAIRDHFQEAKNCAPCLMFIDEIDAITPKREGAQREMEKRIVAQLLTCMDDLDPADTDGKPVIVLAATNRPDSLDTALRRGGRFDKEIAMPVPNEHAREQILRALTYGEAIAPDVNFALLAQRTPGYVGADLDDLVSTASSAATNRLIQVLELEAQSSTMEIDNPSTSLTRTTTTIMNQTVQRNEQYQTDGNFSEEVQSLRRLIKYLDQSGEEPSEDQQAFQITMADFLDSLPKVQPSALREGFATIPSTTFASIGALSYHIASLEETIIAPILNPKLYSNLPLRPESGVLLWGPPGCGKTLLAKAAANSSHANFISVKGPELLNKYLGESERAVRQVFNRARSSVPVIIFFDEFDALCPRRDGTTNEAVSRIVNTFLTELDGFGSSREGIYIMAATNRPDLIDPAMLRPGRVDNLLYVGLPDAEGRVDILQTLCRGIKNLQWSEDFAAIARQCDGFSGADIESLLKHALHVTVKRAKGNADVSLIAADLEIAKNKMGRSVSVDDMKKYERLLEKWGKSS